MHPAQKTRDNRVEIILTLSTAVMMVHYQEDESTELVSTSFKTRSQNGESLDRSCFALQSSPMISDLVVVRVRVNDDLGCCVGFELRYRRLETGDNHIDSVVSIFWCHGFVWANSQK